jgi:hypothetical protein
MDSSIPAGEGLHNATHRPLTSHQLCGVAQAGMARPFIGSDYSACLPCAGFFKLVLAPDAEQRTPGTIDMPPWAVPKKYKVIPEPGSMLDALMEACGQETRCLRHLGLHPNFGRGDYEGTATLVVTGRNPAKDKPHTSGHQQRVHFAADPKVSVQAFVLLNRVQESRTAVLLCIGLTALLPGAMLLAACSSKRTQETAQLFL